MNDHMRIVITGASGNVGAKVRKHFETTGRYDLVLIDRTRRADDSSINVVDLSSPMPKWSSLLAGADAVIHLAANPSPDARWSELIGPNVDSVANICIAARDNKVPRLVLTSSVWAKADRRSDRSRRAADIPEPGINPYAVSKMFAERLGQAVTSQDMSVLAVRLGYVPGGGGTVPASLDQWDRDCWLGDEDLVRGYECAVQSDFRGFQVINLMSNNPAMPWSLEEAEKIIGFRPQQSLSDMVGSSPVSAKSRRFLFWKKRWNR